ncbi:MAG: tetratricopeptide repeat protein [Planctomycetales bacterium]|nr:tetratricopeptide repeat protein [Planctomycetales bacterium]
MHRNTPACIALLVAASLLVTAKTSAQVTNQPMVPANFGAPQLKEEGNWLTKRLPWNKQKDTKYPTSTREPITPKKVSPEQKREGKFSMGRLAERRDQTDAAKSIYERLIAEDPKDARPYHRLGVIAARKGDFKSSAELLTKARGLNPRDPEILRDLGYLYYKNDRLDDAEKLYQQGLQLDPSHQGLANNYAMLMAERGQYRQAMSLFQSVNEPAEAHANMGFMLVQMGYAEKAEAYFNHALTLDKDLKSAAHGLIQTAQIRQQAEAMKRQQELEAEQSKPAAAVASLADDAGQATRIATEDRKPVDTSNVQVVARLEQTTPAPPAQRVEPVRINMSSSSESRGGTLRTTRRAIGTKPEANADPEVTLGPSTQPAPGPVRQRNSLRIRSSATEQVPTAQSQASPTQATSPRVETPAATGQTRGLPSAQFNWSTSQFPTAQPTWTAQSNAEKTEVPATVVR